MKITSVDVIRMNGHSVVEGVPWNPTVVRINTDEGLFGLGEIGLAYGNAKEAQFGMAKDFAELIIGEDPFRIEAIWEKIYRQTFWGMGGGTVIFAAISAIDNALWDLKGKALGVPVYQLLGGKTNEKLRTYASQIQFDWGPTSRPMVTPEDYAEVTLKAKADGYSCVKVDPVGFNLEGQWMARSNYGLLEYDQLNVAVDRVRAIREAGGAAMDIIIELHSLTDKKSAIQLGRELEQFRCFYYEEPTGPLNPKLFREIADSVKIPMASGERIYSRWGYRQFFEDGSLQIIQPDLGNCGGLSEGKKICDMGNTYDVGVQLHVCGGPVATATALQLEAVIPNFVIHEHHAVSLLPANIAGCVNDYQPRDGYFSIPDEPGIGQDLSEQGYAEAYIETVQ